MIAGCFHRGSGLGNQLHRYVMTRVLAMDIGTDFGMVNPGNFKGFSFLNLDFGYPVEGITNEYIEAKTMNAEFNFDNRGYDWEGVINIKDNTVIDGEFQGEKYYEHHKELIRRWLDTEPLDMSEDLCIIAFRGGEYTIFPDLFLKQEYWDRAIERMKEINPRMKFRVVTDDVETAKKFFPDIEVTHEIGMDWRQIKYASYLILSNSSFSILPAWLNRNVKYVIAPWGWARHNLGLWALEQNKMKGWHYQKLDGTYEIYS